LLCKYEPQNWLRLVDDYDFIDFIKDKRRVIVTGEGGGGKSMFMRYLWIVLAEESNGKIPIFIELKNIKSNVKLVDYIYYAATTGSENDRIEQFLQLLKDGRFSLILDGFDEIKIDARDRIQNEIFELAELYSKNIIVVSGRSDDRYNGWSRFERSKVCPLDKKQSITLIERVDYYEDITSEFLSKLKADQFSAQRTFLERPLLLCMMLLTYKHFREIPNKLHLFYSNAFDAMYREHDSFKDGFKRDMHVKVQPDIFRRILSYMCLFSYKEQKIEFTLNDLLDYINKALRAVSSNESSEKFLNDLIESVCVIQKEGFVYSFVHRSFQEYFTAECLKTLNPSLCEKLLLDFSRRSSDNVISMLNDMNPDLVMTSFVLKFIRANSKKIADISKAEKFADMLDVTRDTIEGNMQIKRKKDNYDLGGFMMMSPISLTDFLARVETIMKCCGLELSKPLKRADRLGSPNFPDFPTRMMDMVSVKSFGSFKDEIVIGFIYRPGEGYFVTKLSEYDGELKMIDRQESGEIFVGRGSTDEKILDDMLTEIFAAERQFIAKCAKLKRSLPAIRRRKKEFDGVIGGMLLKER